MKLKVYVGITRHQVRKPPKRKGEDISKKQRIYKKKMKRKLKISYICNTLYDVIKEIKKMDSPTILKSKYL